MPLIVLERTSVAPLRQQIYDQLSQLIRTGALRDQARLPSSRKLAELLQVSRNTVLSAYDDLAADDLIRGQVGSGMRVNRTVPDPGGILSGLQDIIRAAHYPANVVNLTDPDGNPLYIRV